MKKIVIFLLLMFLANPVFASIMGQYKQIMVINFEDVVDTSSMYDKNSLPKVKEGTRELLEKLRSEGQYDLVMYTVGKPKDVARWLMLNNIDQYFKDITNLKYPAQMYLDKRVIPFNSSYAAVTEDDAEQNQSEN